MHPCPGVPFWSNWDYGAQIELLPVLDEPAASGKLFVDVVPGYLFRRLIHDLRIPVTDVIANNMKDQALKLAAHCSFSGKATMHRC
jgi:hypothetical protein